MNEAVENGTWDTIATRNILHSQPPQWEDGRVVVYMKNAAEMIIIYV